MAGWYFNVIVDQISVKSYYDDIILSCFGLTQKNESHVSHNSGTHVLNSCFNILYLVKTSNFTKQMLFSTGSTDTMISTWSNHINTERKLKGIPTQCWCLVNIKIMISVHAATKHFYYQLICWLLSRLIVHSCWVYRISEIRGKFKFSEPEEVSSKHLFFPTNTKVTEAKTERHSTHYIRGITWSSLFLSFFYSESYMK